MRYLAAVLGALAMLTVATTASAQEAPPLGSPIVQAPAPDSQSHSSSGGNVNVTVEAPHPDGKQMLPAYTYLTGNWEIDHAQAFVDWGGGLLKGNNIWTNTPTDAFNQGLVQGFRNSAQIIAIGLFGLGIIYVGIQLVVGVGTGHTSMSQLFPIMIGGFLLAMYAAPIAMQAISLNNWMCQHLAQPSLVDFVGNGITLPDPPQTDQGSSPTPVPPSFFTSLIGALVMVVVLLVLELQMIFREAVLLVGSIVLPISGALYAFSITRSFGHKLYLMFFGWLFGQPLVVLCLALGTTIIDILHVPNASDFLVKLAVLLLAIKIVHIFTSAISPSGMFGMAGLMFLLRRGMGQVRGTAGAAAGGAASQATNRAAVQPGSGGGTGDGSAATGRAWRPAMGTA